MSAVSMSPYCFFNSKFIQKKDIYLHISDLSIGRGYGAFDFFPVVNRKVFRAEDYLTRFFHSCETLHLKIPYSKVEVNNIINQLIKKNQLQEAFVRLLITGGNSEDNYTIAMPNFIILIQENIPDRSEYWKKGATLISHPHLREIPHIKSINYITSISLKNKIQKYQATDVLYHHKGHILEGSRSNFFLIRENTLITPQEQILKGITRKCILEIAKADFDIEARNVKVEEIIKSEEAFTSSSGSKIVPIIKVDDQIISDGKIGKKTHHLMEKFRTYFERY